MVFPNPTFVEEVVLEEIEIGFGRIVRSVELIVGRETHCRLRDLVNDIRVSDTCVTERERRTSLTIRSCVLMTAPLSRRCIERSVSGLFLGFLCSISRMALSKCVWALDMVIEREGHRKGTTLGCTLGATDKPEGSA